MIQQYVAITKTGELLIVTPLFTKIKVDNILDNMAGFSFELTAKSEDPKAYVLEIEEKCQVFGPSILKNIEIIDQF